MDMADVENPNPGGGVLAGDMDVAAAEADDSSKCSTRWCVALWNCTILAVSATILVVHLSSRSGKIRARFWDIFWLVVGIVGLVYGARRCAVTADKTCVRGNAQGIDQTQTCAGVPCYLCA
ncbi:hypothetical protein ACUV84_035233 [Puccinellia chinampoensis]